MKLQEAMNKFLDIINSGNLDTILVCDLHVVGSANRPYIFYPYIEKGVSQGISTNSWQFLDSRTVMLNEYITSDNWEIIRGKDIDLNYIRCEVSNFYYYFLQQTFKGC